jgi:hypothetical protein
MICCLAPASAGTAATGRAADPAASLTGSAVHSGSNHHLYLDPEDAADVP